MLFTNVSKLLFIFMMSMGTLITISSNSWPATWMGLEINLLSIIPILLDKNVFSTEATLKYFLVQALASSIFLFSIMAMFTLNFDKINSMLLQTMISSTLMMKLGAAPFHYWFPSVMEGLSWMNCLIMMTWQKLAPLMIFTYLLIFSKFIMMVIVCSVIIGSIGGLNQTSIRKLLAYSSINHIGWMLAALKCGENLWFTYFLFYTLLSFTLILIFNQFSLNFMNQIQFKLNKSPEMMFILMLSMLSLGGLPPFVGFLPKWLIINSMVEENLIILSLIMVLMTLITLFFYVRLALTSLILLSSQLKWNTQPNYNAFTKSITIFTILSNLGLLIYPIFAHHL